MHVGLKTGLVALSFCMVCASAHAEIADLPADEAYALVRQGELVLIDVRTPSEWAMTGMPKDSIGAPLQDPDFLTRVRSAVLGDLHAPIAVICRETACSAEAARMLAEEGFTRIFQVPEGIGGSIGSGLGWVTRGLPTDPFIQTGY